MKRSVAVSVVAMGAIISACSDVELPTGVYSSVEECVSSGGHGRAMCEADFAKAKKEHEKNAPAFASLKDCEQEFGSEACVPASSDHSSGTSAFIPLMAGYMLGSTLNNSRDVPASPLYRPTKGKGFYNGQGAHVAPKTGPVTLSSNSTAAYTSRTKTVARGGFGSRSISVSA